MLFSTPSSNYHSIITDYSEPGNSEEIIKPNDYFLTKAHKRKKRDTLSKKVEKILFKGSISGFFNHIIKKIKLTQNSFILYKVPFYYTRIFCFLKYIYLNAFICCLSLSCARTRDRNVGET